MAASIAWLKADVGDKGGPFDSGKARSGVSNTFVDENPDSSPTGAESSTLSPPPIPN